MPADEHCPRSLEHIEPAAQHVIEVVLNDRWGRRRQRGDRQCRFGHAAHRIDVAERMGGGDTPEQIGVVDHCPEEVDGLQQRGRPGKRDQRGIVRTVEADHHSVAHGGLQPFHDTCKHRGRHFRGAAAAAHRVFGLIRGHFRQFAVAAHPAPIDPLLEPPQPGAVGGEWPARGDGTPVSSADQRQPAPLRHRTPGSFAGERPP